MHGTLAPLKNLSVQMKNLWNHLKNSCEHMRGHLAPLKNPLLLQFG